MLAHHQVHRVGPMNDAWIEFNFLAQPGSPFSGQKIKGQVNLKQQKVQFLQHPFHPNIDQKGFLHFPKAQGRPYSFYTLQDIASTLLSKPNLRPELIGNPRAASMYLHNPAQYFIAAQKAISSS